MSEKSKIPVAAMLVLSAALVGTAHAQEGAAEARQKEATAPSFKQVVAGASTLTQVHVLEAARAQIDDRGAAVTHVEALGSPLTQVSSGAPVRTITVSPAAGSLGEIKRIDVGTTPISQVTSGGPVRAVKLD